ncbi:MAG: FkbM family methyltransferase [Armatimonadetes bacterium]|nr:FkbM family methyltransferase [Armatimonadota bacterium]
MKRLRKALGPLAHALMRNVTYRMNQGPSRGMKRKGGFGFLYKPPSREETFITSLNLEGKVVYDIGSHIGLFTMYFAKAVGPNGQVIAFEPHPLFFRKVSEHIAINKLDNATARNFAIGGEKGMATMTFRPGFGGTPSIEPGHQQNMMREKGIMSADVPVDTIDNQIAENNLPPPNFVKMDVEGFEVPALLGMRETLEKHHPALFIELHGVTEEMQVENAQKVVDYLVGFGYDITHVESGDKIVSANAPSAKMGHLYCV